MFNDTELAQANSNVPDALVEIDDIDDIVRVQIRAS